MTDGASTKIRRVFIVPTAGKRFASVPPLTILRLTPTDDLPGISYPSLVPLQEGNTHRRATDTVSVSTVHQKAIFARHLVRVPLPSNPVLPQHSTSRLVLRSTRVIRAANVITYSQLAYATRASLADTSLIYQNNRVHEHEKKKMCLTMESMVGFTCLFDSLLNVATAKGLNTLASGCETAKIPFQGVRIGVQRYEALMAAIRDREGFEDVLLAMHDLTDAIGLAKKAIRNHRGLVVTTAMKEDLQELISFYARTGAGAVTCTPFNELQLQGKPQTRMGMFDRELSLIIRMEAGMVKGSASSSEMDNAVSTLSRSRASSITTSLSLVSSQSVSSSGTAIGAEVSPSVGLVEPVSPGVEVVVAARQPLGRVDLLVACLPDMLDTATIRRWCLRAINVCSSRARSWM